MKELFSVTVFANGYTHRESVYNNLPIVIIRDLSKKSLYEEDEYREMIDGYDGLDESSKIYSRDCIDECFTKDEAEQVRTYFKSRIEKGEKITVEKFHLPIHGNFMPTGAIPVGGGNDLILFSESKKYPLKFKIMGYFDTRNLTPVSTDKTSEPKGKIVKTKDGYSVETISIYVLRYFKIKPQPITLSDSGDWTRHDCCICGTSFKPYTPQAVIEHQDTTYNICDICLERDCPELYIELKKQQAKFDKQYIQDKK